MGTEAERLSAARGKEEQLLASDALQMPLAPGWEAIDDPGGTYYYNSTTGESTYEKPVLARTITLTLTRTPTLISTQTQP